MSCKSTILLTKDNEHWYEYCGYPETIELEFDHENAKVSEDEKTIYIQVKKESDLFKRLNNFKESKDVLFDKLNKYFEINNYSYKRDLDNDLYVIFDSYEATYQDTIFTGTKQELEKFLDKELSNDT